LSNSGPAVPKNNVKTSTIQMLLCSVMVIFAACDRFSAGVVCWPSNISRTSSTVINDDSQIKQLQKADPKKDAREAFWTGDYRFMADRPALSRVPGVAYDSIVDSSRRRYGLKIVAFSEKAVYDSNFFEMRLLYSEAYNVELHSLMSGSTNK